MEIQGGISEELKQKIADTKVAIIGNQAVDLIFTPLETVHCYFTHPTFFVVCEGWQNRNFVIQCWQVCRVFRLDIPVFDNPQ